jgi:hypothetical protein
MVRAVRDGDSIRAVAQRFRTSASTVQFWVERCHGKRLDRCDFANRKPGAPRPWNRIGNQTERAVLTIRRELKERSILGEYGAPAIRRAMLRHGYAAVPSIATISRVLERRGAVDAVGRQRRAAPPAGWYLPAVAAGQSALDSFDIIEDLKLERGPWFSVLTATSLPDRRAQAWPHRHISASYVVDCLIERWRQWGLPGFAQFDNDTRFQGAHQWADSIGRVSRLCLALGVVPVFAPPREPGFQNSIESFNALWQAKVWQRFRFDNLQALIDHSTRYTQAYWQRARERASSSAQRREFPKRFRFDLSHPLHGTLIYVRRTDERGHVQLLGHKMLVDALWINRLVRCEVQLDHSRISCFALRRRAPEAQILLAKLPYLWPDKPFKGNN